MLRKLEMLTPTEELLGFQINPQSGRVLANRTFSKLRIEELVFGPLDCSQDNYVVEDCSFVNCVVKPGPLLIFGGVQLKNVIFDNIRSNDGMTISSHALLDHVIIRGKSKSAGIWIKPFSPPPEVDDSPIKARMAKLASKIEWMLDISEFEGVDVEILGLPEEKVIINKTRHVVVRRSMKVDWDGLGFPKHSLWRIAWFRLNSFDVNVGIYDIPSPDQNEKAFREFEILRKLGIL